MLNKYIHFVEWSDFILAINLSNGKKIFLRKNIYEKDVLPFIVGCEIDYQKQNKYLKLFIENKFIVKDNETLYNKMLIDRNIHLLSEKSFRLTLIPTLECNFNCWYCYETHPKSQMDIEVFSSTKKLIKKLCENPNITRLHFDWFGGEPLLYFYEIIYPLAKYAKNRAREKGMEFFSTITTNAFLLNEDIVKKMKVVQITGFQITIDGNKEMHNKIRKLKLGEGTFDKIIENLHLIDKFIDNSKITLRINYTSKTLKNLEDIIPLFEDSLKRRMLIMLQRVWQSIDSESDSDSVDLPKLITKLKESGFNIQYNQNNYAEKTRCYADYYSQAVINYNGLVFKCTARDFHDSNHSDGVLKDDGEISWNYQKLKKRIIEVPYNNNVCKECKFLPLCLGTCSQKYLDKQDFYKIECHFKEYEATVNEELYTSFYDYAIAKNNI